MVLGLFQECIQDNDVENVTMKPASKQLFLILRHKDAVCDPTSEESRH